MGSNQSKDEKLPQNVPAEQESSDIGSDDVKAVSSSSNKLTAQLFTQLCGDDDELKNHLVSGFGLSTAMAMLSLGAKEETLEEIQKCFRFNVDLEDHKYSYKETLACFVSSNSKIIVGQEILMSDILKSFADDVNHFLSSDTTNLEFGAPAFAFINTGLLGGDTTVGEIDTLVPAEDFKVKTPMQLLNSVYFKSDWAQKVDSSKTKVKDFYLSGDESGPKVRHEMMTRHNVAYGFVERLNATAIELPYKGFQFSMVILLPREKRGYEEMERNLRNIDLGKDLLIDKRADTVTMPKFKAESSNSMIPLLRPMGITTAFDGRAKFGGLSKEPSYVGVVWQKATLEVDEKGTAAHRPRKLKRTVTLVEPATGWCPFHVRIDVNRPFVYLIRHRASGLVLFIGRMMNPKI